MNDRREQGFSGVSWLFSPREDLLAFVAPALIAIAITLYLSAHGLLAQPLEPLGWLLAVVLVDVAHVYATLYRVYANPTELRRRLALYTLVPLIAYAVGILLYVRSGLTFWRVLAYLAVFHFVRQQYGWVALSGRKECAFSTFDRRLDAVAVYAGTLYPILYWHVKLPRRFAWFVNGDFLSLKGPAAEQVLALAAAAYIAIGVLWVGRQLQRIAAGKGINATRILVMLTTWATWYLGIVHYNSDVAFTLTNVLPHGIPYFVLLFRYRRNELAEAPRARPMSPYWAVLLFYLPLALLAFAEEGVWDRLVWHDHGFFFPGSDVFLSELTLCFLVPLLALPQATHYLLDAWIWKVGPRNPDLKRRLGL